METEAVSEDQETLRTITEAERKVAKKEAALNALKEDMKIAREEFDGAVEKLRALCRQQANDASRPLLDVAEGKAAENGEAVAEKDELVPIRRSASGPKKKKAAKKKKPR